MEKEMKEGLNYAFCGAFLRGKYQKDEFKMVAERMFCEVLIRENRKINREARLKSKNLNPWKYPLVCIDAALIYD